MSEENKYTFENEEYRRTYWHTCSHVLAQAVKRLYPEVKLAIGPSPLKTASTTIWTRPLPSPRTTLAEIEARDAEDLQGEAEAGAV